MNASWRWRNPRTRMATCVLMTTRCCDDDNHASHKQRLAGWLEKANGDGKEPTKGRCKLLGARHKSSLTKTAVSCLRWSKKHFVSASCSRPARRPFPRRQRSQASSLPRTWWLTELGFVAMAARAISSDWTAGQILLRDCFWASWSSARHHVVTRLAGRSRLRPCLPGCLPALLQ